MIDKRLLFLSAFLLALTFIFMTTPGKTSASTAVNEYSDANLSEAPYRDWFVVAQVTGPKFKYFQMPKHGRRYRGYLPRGYEIEGIAQYAGWLYRDDLPYPISLGTQD